MIRILLLLLALLLAAPPVLLAQDGSEVLTKEDLLEECAQNAPTISVDQAKLLFDRGEALFLDCRERLAFRAGHIPGAVHVPRGMLEFTIGRIAPDKTRPIVLYCRSGQRACLGAQTLQRLGYVNAVNLDHGWLGWDRAWYPVQ